MNILFFAGIPKSHIVPISSTINYLIKQGHTVYCFGYAYSETQIKELGAKYIEYPFNILDEDLLNKADLFNKISVSEYDESNYIKAQLYELLSEAVTSNCVDEQKIKAFQEYIINLSIDLIFTDMINRYGKRVGNSSGIPCIGYVTHNLYSEEYFSRNPDYYYKIYMYGILKEKELPQNFFSNFWELEQFVYEMVGHFNEIKYPASPFEFLDQKTQYTIIYSTKKVQPIIAFEQERENVLIYPEQQRFENEPSCCQKLEKFLKKKQEEKIIYISSGGYTSQHVEYYKKIIYLLNLFSKKYLIKLKIIISALDQYDALKKMINELNLSIEIYVDKYVPQQYVLKNTDIFITSGGHNSILEGIYHKVPLLVTPLTSEQRLNGIEIEKGKLGFTTYNIRDHKLRFDEMIIALLENLEIKKEILDASEDMKKYQNPFEQIDCMIKSLTFKKSN